MNYENIFRLDKKLVFVLGGSGYIGQEVVKGLLASGAKVVVLDKYKINFPGIVKFYSINFESTTSYKKKIISSFKKFGTPDILINTSYPKSKDWKFSKSETLKLGSLEKNIKIHLNSYLWIMNSTAIYMKRAKINGSIINLSSMYGIVSQDPEVYKNTNKSENVIYSAIKGGINSFSKQLAVIYGKHNIRVNTICPGGVINKKDYKKLKINKNFRRNYFRKSPIKRFATTHDVACATIFLSSDASKYITGTNLTLDGGWTAL
jgi:NAD(P)-dependent dehydrogenase (short-subunit alcohol dehydrogenase family)